MKVTYLFSVKSKPAIFKYISKETLVFGTHFSNIQSSYFTVFLLIEKNRKVNSYNLEEIKNIQIIHTSILPAYINYVLL